MKYLKIDGGDPCMHRVFPIDVLTRFYCEKS